MARGTVGWNRKTGRVEWIPGDEGEPVVPGRMARAGAVVFGLLVTAGYIGVYRVGAVSVRVRQPLADTLTREQLTPTPIPGQTVGFQGRRRVCGSPVSEQLTP